jgi:hypothetical protein
MQRGHNTRLDTELSENKVLLGSEDNVTCTENKVSCTREKAQQTGSRTMRVHNGKGTTYRGHTQKATKPREKKRLPVRWLGKLKNKKGVKCEDKLQYIEHEYNSSQGNRIKRTGRMFRQSKLSKKKGISNLVDNVGQVMRSEKRVTFRFYRVTFTEDKVTCTYCTYMVQESM